MIEVNKSTIKNQLYEIIKNKILNQEYCFGDKINISNLSKELNVSNTPIREALAMLEMKGLITISTNVGPKIINFTESSYNDLTETLKILILGGYDLCITNKKIDKLIITLESRLNKQTKIIKKNNILCANAAIFFDESFISVTQNKRLISTFKDLSDLLLLAVIYDYNIINSDKNESVYSHQKILDTIVNGSHTEAKKLISEHYDRKIIFKNNFK